MNGKLIIFSAPSGSGKSTIIGKLKEAGFDFGFSISATSRAPRGTEQHGVEYYFLTPNEFRAKIANDEFVEYEEVYAGSFYGTLKSEVERIWAKGHTIIFDIDVQGGVNLKRIFGEQALSVFIQAPSVEILRERLVGRGTDTDEAIERRVAKAASEMEFAAGKFDYVLINDDLATAKAEAEKNEIRKAIANDAVAAPVIKEFKEEKREMKTNEEIRKSQEYVDAYARYLVTENDAECRALLTSNVSGSVPVPVIVDEIIRTAWDESDILSRVRKTNIKGNLKVAFELRYVQRMRWADVGAQMGLSKDCCKRMTERYLERSKAAEPLHS